MAFLADLEAALAALTAFFLAADFYAGVADGLFKSFL
jgi:hypothetical protein